MQLRVNMHDNASSIAQFNMANAIKKRELQTAATSIPVGNIFEARVAKVDPNGGSNLSEKLHQQVFYRFDIDGRKGTTLESCQRGEGS